MNPNEIKAQAVKLQAARGSLIAVIAFTAINIGLSITGSDIQFLFSAPLPTLIVSVARGLGGAFLPVGAILALFATSLYLGCWWLSKKYRVFILVALILFSLETVLHLLLIIPFVIAGVSLSAGEFIGLAFHGWILYSLLFGAIAWYKLRAATPEAIQTAKTEAEDALSKEQTNSAMDDLSNNE